MPAVKLSTRDRLKIVDKSFHSRLRRVRKRLWPIVQSALAATIAYWVAVHVAGHPYPFFAPISAVIILGLTGGERMKRALEMSLGCVLGVGLADLVIPLLGPGVWQLGVAVGIALVVASFLSASPLVNNQMAIGSILISVTVPIAGAPTAPGGPDRMVDAIIGSITGLVVIAFLPSSPLAAGRQELSKVLTIASSVLGDVAKALKDGDEKTLAAALNAVRDTQGDIDKMLDAAKIGKESTTLSPLLWASRRRVRILERIVMPLDNCVRNCRVLARRAVTLTEDDDEVSQTQIELIDELSDITLALSEVYEAKPEVSEATQIPLIVNQLRALGARTGMEVAEGRVLSAYALLAQTRSIIVDLLQVCGMSRESALAVLEPTSSTPAYPPEIYDD